MLFKPFGSKDERMKVALDTPEPLIHFALVCGAKSCPPIKTYTAAVSFFHFSPVFSCCDYDILLFLQNVNKELALAAESFLESDEALRVDKEKSTIHLSMIFKWYGVDFGANQQEVKALTGLMLLIVMWTVHIFRM